MRLANWLYTLPLRVRSLVLRKRQNADLNEELRDHIERQIEENLARGMDKEEARAAAKRAFGNLVVVREQTHEAWGWASLERLGQDLLHAFRSARRSPLLSAVAVVALSLGMGLNTGVFTMLNAMFLRSPTLHEPGSFVQLCPRYSGWFTGANQFSSFTTEDFDAIRIRTHALDEVAAWSQSSATPEQGKTRINTLHVTCNYFHVLGVDRPLMGRLFAAGDCSRSAAARVAVLSQPYWKSKFGADPKIVGQTIHLNGIPLEVIGIVPADAANFMIGGVFLPYTLQPQFDRTRNLLVSPDMTWLSLAGRLRQGYTRADAQAELLAIMSQQDRAYVERRISVFNRKTYLVMTNGSFIENPANHDIVIGLMVLILGPLALILLLACSNVTMLFLSRTIVRSGEIAIRLALGVRRRRLASMLLVESLLTVCIGGVLSVPLADRVPIVIMNMADRGQADFVVLLHPDWRVFGYLAILLVVATATSAFMPIRAAWKLDLLTALKGREGAATFRSRSTTALIVVQIGLSFVLMCAAVFFGRLPGLIKGMNPGFDIHHIVAVPLDVDLSAGNRTKALTFYGAVEAKILAIPGVQSFAYARLQPFNQVPPSEIRLPGESKGSGMPASIDTVSASFFSTFDIQALRGRAFLPTDVTSPEASNVAVVSQAFTEQFWPGTDPIGKSLVTPDDRHLTVVGVVPNTRSERYGAVDGPRLYVLRGPLDLGDNLYVRFTGNTKTLEQGIRDAIKTLDATQVIAPETIWEELESNAEQAMSLARIILAMASIALLMAVIGVYGVLSFAVNRRTREFGIKMVLGADRGAIFRSVILRAAKSIVLGLLFGMALAEPARLLFAHLLARSPLPLHSVDFTVFGVSAVLLAAVSLSAMYLPAARAMRTDPMRALRTE
jgi:predicted permease